MKYLLIITTKIKSHKGKLKMKAKLIAAAVSASILTTGCMTFSDKNIRNLHESEVATLHAENILFPVLEVDGESTHYDWWPVDLIKLAPGEHSIKVKWNHFQYATTTITKWIKAEPGKKYKITGTADTTAMKWGFRIVDTSTEEPVDFIK